MQGISKQHQIAVEDHFELICRYLPDCTLSFANLAYCSHYGKDRQELMGRRRHNIRTKLGITNKEVNLNIFLQEL